jgi:hypothetical protein
MMSVASAEFRIPITPLEARVIRALIFGIGFFLIATFPATWLLMLFLGNMGVQQSYWGTLPLGVLVSVLLAGVSTPNVTVVKP